MSMTHPTNGYTTINNVTRSLILIAICVVVTVYNSLLHSDRYAHYESTSSSSSSSSCIQQTIANADPNADPNPNSQPYDSFNNTNPFKNSWCPHATCQNSPMCSPCNRRYLFILATGRSGSTTLLKMLNYLPNVRLSGENNNILYIASKLISNFQGNKVAHLLHQHFDRTEGAFLHNAIMPQTMSCPIQHILHTMNPPPLAVQQRDNVTDEPSVMEYDQHLILGVKTIRYQKSPWDVRTAAHFLKDNFPCSRVVVNICSDIDSQSRSIDQTFTKGKETKTKKQGRGQEQRQRRRQSKQQNDPEMEEDEEEEEDEDEDHHRDEDEDEEQEKDDARGEKEMIQEMNDFLTQLTDELGEDMAKLIDMTQWTRDVNVLNDVVAWLGFRHCEFHSIVHENAGGFERDHDTTPNISDKCHYPH